MEVQEDDMEVQEETVSYNVTPAHGINRLLPAPHFRTCTPP